MLGSNELDLKDLQVMDICLPEHSIYHSSYDLLGIVLTYEMSVILFTTTMMHGKYVCHDSPDAHSFFICV